MVISVPRTDAKVRASPHKYVPLDAKYFGPVDSDSPGHVPISWSPLDWFWSSARRLDMLGIQSYLRDVAEDPN